MARVNIYVPDDLKRRMDEAEGVNWSPLACRAFEMKLAEIITQKGAKDMNEVIARLRASKAATSDEATIKGREAGRVWASNAAEAADLQRLEEWTESDFGVGWSWNEYLMAPGRDEAFGQDHRLAEAIAGEDFDRQEGDRFWDGVATDADRESPAFLVGFIEGALGIWEQVKDQL